MKKFLSFFAVIAVVLMAAPSFAAEAKVSGYYELKAFAYDNADLNNAQHDKVSYATHEFRLNLDIEEGPVMGRLQINSATNNSSDGGWGNAQNSSSWNREMFLVFPVGSLKVKVGKMWGDDLFNGLMFIDVKDALTITSAVSNINLIASIVNMDDDNNKNDNFISLTGTYAPEGSIFSGSLGWYYRITNDSSTSGTYIEDRPQYLAAAISIAQEPWTFNVTGVGMFGDKDITTGATTSYGYKAYAFDVRAGYDFSKGSGIPLSAKVIFGLGSGDDNPNDRDFESFQGIAPGYYHGAIFKDVGDPSLGGAPGGLNHGGIETNGIGNQRMLALNFIYKATDDLSLGLFGGMFWLTEKTNVNLNSTSGTSYRDDHLGNELAITADYSLVKNLNLHLQAAWFDGDDGMYAASASSMPGDVASEYLAMLGWYF